MSKGGSPKQRVTEYFCSVHYGICQGQVDSLNFIRINDKIAWTGNVIGPTLFTLSSPDLFGGLNKEGGVSGHIFWQDGSFGQYAPASLAAKFDRTPANMPANRGLANAFFTGPGSLLDEDGDTEAPADPVEAAAPEKSFFFKIFSKFKEAIVGYGGGSELTTNPGFYWSANQPFIWPCHFGVTRIPSGWYPQSSTVFHSPEVPIAVCITIEASTSMTTARLNAVKTAVGGVLDNLRGAIERDGLQVDLSIGAWAGTILGGVEYIGATVADIDEAKAFVESIAASGSSANFENAALIARNFFLDTINVVYPPEPELLSRYVRVQPPGGEGSPPNLYFAPDTAPPYAAGDDVEITWANNGLTDTITIVNISGSPDGDIWWEFSGALTNIPFFLDESGGTGILVPNVQRDPPTVDGLRDIAQRLWIFISDGDASGTSAADAVVVAADLLDQESGFFSRANGTQVECFSFNIDVTDISESSLLDNTPGDGVPVISSEDPGALLFSLQKSVFRGKNPDAGPAHIIYECLTDSAWGMGAPSSAIDSASFEAVADTLLAEGFGLGLIWTRQQPIEDFVKEVLDHIDATLYVDPETGKFNLKLIRDDYELSEVPLFDLSTMRVRGFSRRAPSEIINEINLTWTNPETEKEEVITGQDLGAIVVNNGVINSDSRNYYGVRDVRLANRILSRDLSAATAPLASAEIEVNRKAWNQFPGSVIRFYSPEHDSAEIVMRVTKINYGKPGDSKIVISMTQDIFSFQKPTLALPPKTQSQTAPLVPEPFRYVVFQTLNYFFNKFYGYDDLEEPEARVAIMASTPNRSALEANVVGETVDSAGNVVLGSLATIGVTGRAVLSEDFAVEVETTTPGFSALSKGKGPTVGGFGLIQRDGESELQSELVLFQSFAAGVWTIVRGVLDTVPRDWPAGTPIRFFNEASRLSDNLIRSEEVPIDYQLQMRTALGAYPLASTPVRRFTPTGRAHLPTRPANVRINGVAFDKLEEIEGDLVVTWSNRNRLLEDSQVLSWDDAGVPPEAGQTTRITVIDISDLSVVSEYDEIAGETFTIPIGDLNGTPRMQVKVRSVRDGLVSLQSYDQLADLRIGYGLGYGFNYGGDVRAGYGNGYGMFYGGAE